MPDPAPLGERVRGQARLRLREFARTLAGWVRRHIAVSLVIGAVAVILAPLVFDLYGAIPWPIRKGVGWTLFGTGLLVALARVLEVRATDDRPPVEAKTASGIARVLPYLLAALVLSLAWPLLRQPENLGFGDWDLFLGKHEAARRTIVDYGQFPWWDPWTRGGFPLAANPQCGVVSVQMPFILLFGTSVGMRIGTIVCFLLASEGARRLARLWLGDPWAAFAAGLIYGLNGAVLVAAVAAYHVSMCYPALPWMLYHLARLERRPIDGVGLGFWTAFSVLNGIQYFTTYTVLIAGVIWIRALRARSDRGRLLAHTVLALGVFLALAGWRVATTGLVYRDFPREHHSMFDESLISIVEHLLARHPAGTLAAMEIPYFWETATYIGPIVPLLALASLARGWRWWHTLTLLTVWLGIGSVATYHPSYWLGHWPVFSTMHVVTRWRFMAMLGVALAAAATVAWGRSSDRPWVRRLALLAVAAIAGDYLAYGFEVLPVAFSVAPRESLFPGPPLPADEIVQVSESGGFPAILRGYGVVHGFEPLMGYDRHAPTARLWTGHPRYVGEAWAGDTPLTPTSWSPNRLEFRVAPDQEVEINQNPGSWWVVDGERPFADARCAEKERAFVARADGQGRLVLEIQPRGRELGWVLHGVGFALVGVWGLAWAWRQRPGRDESPGHDA